MYQGQKIFQSANKIFALSKYQPVGVMVYGDAAFMETPWETVIKMYRERVGPRSMPTLHDYADDFLEYLRTEPRISRPEVQREYVRREIFVAFAHIRLELDNTVQALLKVEDEVPEVDIRRAAKKLIRQHRDKWSELPPSEDLPDGMHDRIRELYNQEIAQVQKEVFGTLVTPQASSWLQELAIDVVTKIPPYKFVAGSSGVVIAGFGRDDVFPSFAAFILDAVVEGHLKYLKDGKESITHDSPIVVRPFAQREMVYMFMEGIDPQYRSTVETFTFELLLSYPDELLKHLPLAPGTDVQALRKSLRRIATQTFKKYSAKLGEHRSETYAYPIVRVMSMLPKEELAAAAESLVNITSVKRRFSLQAETVGGPTDVAVISKGDGFIWIKRKHYFDPKLNLRFTGTYFREEADGDEEDGN